MPRKQKILFCLNKKKDQMMNNHLNKIRYRTQNLDLVLDLDPKLILFSKSDFLSQNFFKNSIKNRNI